MSNEEQFATCLAVTGSAPVMVICRQQIMSRKDFEALFNPRPDPEDRPGWVYSYGFPGLTCQNGDCEAVIALPYSPLPQMALGGTPVEGNDPLGLPPDGWSAIFGCIHCGHIATYAASQVEMHLAQKTTRSKFHEHADVWLVIFGCGRKDCAALVSVHLDMREYHATSSKADASDAITAIRSAVFAGQRLPCGHELKTIPQKYYRAEPVTRCMWGREETR